MLGRLGGWGLGEKGEGTKKDKVVVPKQTKLSTGNVVNDSTLSGTRRGLELVGG